jgi:predicted unusual protein kinase regulating ubiquinone biosynthesis (AarF/ABC1/UbiB family)
MSALTRECQVAPFSEVQDTIQEDMGYPIDVVFQSFEETPISSASIAQVHRAQLLNGEKVAVKVQHRHLATRVEKDLLMMRRFVDIALWLFPDFSYKWLVE